MITNSSIEKQRVVVKEFQRLLRSGQDITTNAMYKDAAAKAFMEWRTAGNLIRKYYRGCVTDEMRAFVNENGAKKFDILLALFCEKFQVCKREGRLIIGYIR